MRIVMNHLKRMKWSEILFLTGVFGFIFIWTLTIPFDAAPDESMRFQIADYIMKHGNLPDGRDPEIRNAYWGISYAFNPITTYILAGILAKTVSFFTESVTAIYMSMRFVNVIFGTLTAFLALKIGKRLFEKEAAWFFAVLVSFLPGALFVHSYINMDSIAVFSTAWIFYCWVRALQEGWKTKICMQLAVAMSVCVLSYYNAYGFLLCSALFFAGSMLRCTEKQWNYQEMLKKGILMLAVVFVLTGWWFIRNAVLYDGDILGMRTSTEFSELYAIEELKPSNRVTPQKLGMTVSQMMLWIPGQWEHNWLVTVMISFIGTFGHMDIFMPVLWSKCYIFFMLAGAGANVLYFLKHFSVIGKKVSRKVIRDQNGVTIVKTYRKDKVWNSEIWMRICLILAAVIPCVLLVYYSYCSDFQAQGRYLMPALLPMMYFVTWGYDYLLKKLVKSKKIYQICFRMGTAVTVISSVMVYLTVLAPNY